MRVVLGVEYDGSALHGWQKQPRHPDSTAQALLEDAISHVAGHPVSTVVAGRTDAGVHAYEQVAHFDTSANRSTEAWVRGGNSMLPPAIRILWARPVSDDFHARFSARARRYCYVLSHSNDPVALWRNRYYQTGALSIDHMRGAANVLVGTHDFSSFRAAHCQAKDPRRHIYFIRLHCHNTWTFVDIQANGFLHHMVRNIVGSLLEVGAHLHSPEWMDTLLSCRDREKAPATAPSTALYLTKIRYAPHWGLARRSSLRIPSWPSMRGYP